jgi:hypothetical protein
LDRSAICAELRAKYVKAFSTSDFKTAAEGIRKEDRNPWQEGKAVLE